MQRIGDVAQHAWERIRPAAGVAAEEMVIIPMRGNAPLVLTRTEAAACGARQVGSGEQRHWQLALCRDANGEFVYGPERGEDESPEQIFARAREERRRMDDYCPSLREDPRRRRGQEWLG